MLAAGRGARFGGNKLLAPLDSRPVLQHVLDICAAASFLRIVVVLGYGIHDIRRAITWRSEIQVHNPTPEHGIGGSVALGIWELERSATWPAADRALVLLGDQPRLRLDQIDAMLAAPREAERPIVVPRYAGGVPGNPVLVEKEAWPLVNDLTGDHGMVQLFAAHAELVRYVDVPGSNPDVDTPADLAALKSRRRTSPIRP